ncbi:transporter substrate-binding domain-containing protein [Thalassospira sp. MA62]|nr:transporter substrate-binding domain-containing protein [Thalassospira sp. MA62]
MAWFIVFMTMNSAGANVISDCSRPLTVRASEAYFPFSIKDENGFAKGKDNTFVSRVLKSVGCEPRFVFLPWKRSLYAIEHGEIDILPSASYTDERAEYGLFSVPYRNDVVGFVVRKGDAQRIKLSSLDDVISQNLMIGHVRGAYRGQAFEAFKNSSEGSKHVSALSVAPHGIGLLVAGRVDLLVGIPSAYTGQAEILGYPNAIEEHPFFLAKEPVRLMFSSKTIAPELARKISEAILQESKTEAYRALYKGQVKVRN